MNFGETIALGGLIEKRIEASVHDGGRVTEKVNEVALWMIVHVEDVSRLSDDAATLERTTTSAPKAAARRPAPHDARQR